MKGEPRTAESETSTMTSLRGKRAIHRTAHHNSDMKNCHCLGVVRVIIPLPLSPFRAHTHLLPSMISESPAPLYGTGSAMSSRPIHTSALQHVHSEKICHVCTSPQPTTKHTLTLTGKNIRQAQINVCEITS
jgi:hypothetical protein